MAAYAFELIQGLIGAGSRGVGCSRMALRSGSVKAILWSLLGFTLIVGLAPPAQASSQRSSAASFAAVGASAAAQQKSRPGALERDDSPVARTGKLMVRPAGLPSTSEPARRLQSAEVTQDLLNPDGRVTGTIVLAGAASAATAADLHVVFGSLDGSTCFGNAEVVTSTAALGAGFTGSGSTITLDGRLPEASYAGWDCAFAQLAVAGQEPTAENTYDALIGPLTDVAGEPRLAISDVEMLRSKVKTLKLVPKVWTTLDVTVANSGTASAPGVVLGGGGKGIKVKGETLDYAIGKDGGEGYGEVQVKLTGNSKKSKGKKGKGGKGKRKGKPVLKLSASGAGASASTRVLVKTIKPPPKPASGTYESKDGSVSFTIAGGKVVNWRGRMQTRCGGYPDLPTYTINTYDFPKVKIARNGIVDATQDGNQGGDAAFGAFLQMQVSGSRIRKGYFSYSGPARCFASTSFDAKLKRR